MFFSSVKKLFEELQDTLAAIHRSQAVIEFDTSGVILTANKNFLDAVGYGIDEIRGQHHRMFVDQGYAGTPEYAEFWRRLAHGEFDAGEYRRFGKGGREVWIQASYNPIKDAHGKTYKVVKFACDITARKLCAADAAGQISAMNKSQAVIQFNLDGSIIEANENFLNAVGYSLEELKGKHHRMFVDPEHAATAEYADFWRKLNAGEYQAAQYKRYGRGGREIWIEASYNPILDMNGKPFKVVKYATDITRQTQALADVLANLGDIEASVHSADAQAASASNLANETTANVQAVAAGAEEMSASVREISASMTKSQQAVEDSISKVEAADQSTQKLDNAADAMGGIVNVIQDIAGQINLLALNATIEAARAGEAGKGFAVVADEVKNLAKQAGDATEQISKEISAMQHVSSEVVSALGDIKRTIQLVEGFVTSTAGAVEEQSTVTAEITSSMQRAANAVATISANMGEIAHSVQGAAQTVNATRENARALSR